jgi:peptidase C25-like protein
MRPIFRWVLAVALLPSSLHAAILPEAGPQGSPIARPGAPATPYVVVTERRLQGTFMPLVQARTRAGLSASVVTIESIEQAYPTGVDRAERIRMFLKDAHAQGTQWVLLGGDDSVVPMRRARLRLGPSLGDIDLPTDQYYACLDGTWNADGDAFWGESPGPGEPGDDVDFFPELYVGRAPVHGAAEVAEFVRRTLAYEDRLAAGGPRSALLAADDINSIVDGAQITEYYVRPALEADPDRSIVRMYERAPDWPGSVQESRPALIDALAGGFDLAVLVGAGDHGVLVAGEDYCCDDYVTSNDMLGLTNTRQYPIVFVESAWTTDPDPPLSIGAALMLARRGGAAAVIGTTDVQFVAAGGSLMREFFDQALGTGTPPIGEALAQAIAALSSPQPFDLTRLSTQGTVLFGDPALHLDPVAAPVATRAPRRNEYPVRAIAGSALGAGVLTAVAVNAATATNPAPTSAARAGSSLARATATLRFDLPSSAAGTRYRLAVFDVLGRQVRALPEGTARAGRFEVSWDLRSDAGTRVADGLYFGRLSFAGVSRVSRVLVVK